MSLSGFQEDLEESKEKDCGSFFKGYPILPLDMESRDWQVGKPRGHVCKYSHTKEGKIVKRAFIGVLQTKDRKTPLRKMFCYSRDRTEEQAEQQAREWLMGEANRRGLIDNRIRIIDDRTIEFELDDNRTMLTDMSNSDACQRYKICLRKEKEPSLDYAMMSLGSLGKKNFHSFIMNHDCVRHINGNKMDNRLENLRKVSYFDNAKEFVESKGGEMLSSSEEYKTAHTKLRIKCENGHEFECSLNGFSKSWCPECNIKANEYTTLLALEYLFERPFVKVRPKWLVNEDGNLMEIDCFNEELKLCVEYNGKQHYEYIPHFHRSRELFQKRLRDDKEKRRLCEEMGYSFIEIPFTVETERIINFLLDKTKEMKIDISNDRVEMFEPQPAEVVRRKHEELLSIIEHKGGELLEGKYLTSLSSIKIRCTKGHVFETKGGKVVRGSWCQVCARIVTDETKIAISNSLRKNRATEEGKKLMAKIHEKRSKTMAAKREQLREETTHITCNKCGIEKPVSEYHKRSAGVLGYQSNCKTCINEIKKNWRANKNNQTTLKSIPSNNSFQT